MQECRDIFELDFDEMDLDFMKITFLERKKNYVLRKKEILRSEKDEPKNIIFFYTDR